VGEDHWQKRRKSWRGGVVEKKKLEKPEKNKGKKGVSPKSAGNQKRRVNESSEIMGEGPKSWSTTTKRESQKKAKNTQPAFSRKEASADQES